MAILNIPTISETLNGMIDDWHESQPNPFRPHMGASTLGEPCERKMWLSFRWAQAPSFSGRILRLFRRGQNEETTIIADLQAIGMTITNYGADQARVDFGCHVSGSIDGIITAGVPGSNKPHILEAKTHNDKSFNDLLKHGVQQSKPMHYTQMQAYMRGEKIDRALYVAVNKNDDRYYFERIKLDKAHADKAIQRGQRIALSERMPEPISARADWYQCKMCDFSDICHRAAPVEQHNCRTCIYSQPLEDGTWRCNYHDADGIPVEFQREGCENWEIHRDFLPF